MSNLAADLERLIRAIAREEAEKAIATERAKLAPPEYVTIKEYARRYSIGTSTVRAAIREGRLPAMNVGERSVRVPASASLAKPLRGRAAAGKVEIDAGIRAHLDRIDRQDRLRAGTLQPNPHNADDVRYVAMLHRLGAALQQARTRLLDPHDVAAALGATEKQVRDAIRTGRIPHEKVVGHKLVPKAVVAKLKASGWKP